MDVEVGDNFWIGPWVKVGEESGPFTAGTWSWTGPNGFTSNEREINLQNVTTAQAGEYVATFTSTSGDKTTATIVVTVTDSTSGIDQAAVEKKSEEPIYSINGQKVSSAKNAGIYVQKNKKFIKK